MPKFHLGPLGDQSVGFDQSFIIGSPSTVTPPPASSPITEGAPAIATTSSPVSMSLTGGANSLFEIFVCSNKNSDGADNYDFTIGGVAVQFHTGVDPFNADPECLHYYVNSSAYQALSGAQDLVMTGGTFGSNAVVYARELLGVDDASPIAGAVAYDADEDNAIISITRSVTVNNWVSMAVSHGLNRSWDTYTNLTESATQTERSAVGHYAVTSTEASRVHSISHSSGSSNSRKAGLLIEYKAA